MNNRARGRVYFYFYMNSDGPQSQTLPEDVVVQFSHLDPDMTAFLEDYPGSVAIPNITDKNLLSMVSLHVRSFL